MNNVDQVRDQALSDAVLLAVQSGQSEVAAEVWQWAQNNGFHPDEIKAKFELIITRLNTPTLPQQPQPIAQLPQAHSPTPVAQRQLPSQATDPRISFPSKLETNPAPLKTPDQDSPAEMINSVIETYKLFGIELSPADPSFLEGPRIYQLRFKPKPTSKSLTSSTIEEKLVLEGLPERGLIVRPRSGFLEIQVPRKKWESWNLLDHVRGRALTATSPLILPYGVNLDCKTAIFETIHALIAGMTQGGKTTFEMTLITSAQLWYPPDHLRLVLVDPTEAGFVQNFSDSPWLWNDRVVTESDDILPILDSLFLEYEARGRLFSAHGVTRLEAYNKLNPSAPLPRVLTFIDELFAAKFPFGTHNCPGLSSEEVDDLNKVRGREFDFKLTRLAQEAAKRGMHFFPSTQKPTNQAISTMIRDSMPTKISFRVASESNGEVIFGSSRDGRMAHQLQGKGDMWVSVDGEMHRLQSFNITDDEIRKVVAQGIRHYGSWSAPRRAYQDDLFVSSTRTTSSINTSDPDYSRWCKFQEIKNGPKGSQAKALREIFGEDAARGGKDFYDAKAKVEEWSCKFGGAS